MQIMPRSVKFMHTMPVGQTRPAQFSTHAVCISPSTVTGAHAGTAVPPGVGGQSIAGFVQSSAEQKPSVMFAFVMQKPGLPHSIASMHGDQMPSIG